MDVTSIIAAARRQAGLTQAELAKRVNTSQSAIACIEGGQGNPSIETIVRLVEAAGFRLRIELTSPEIARDAVIDAYKAHVDRTLIRDNLRKSVNQRLRDAEAFRKSAESLRG